jgi:SP family general alpha glucoside:H+ symporter-like MFS transporter
MSSTTDIHPALEPTDTDSSDKMPVNVSTQPLYDEHGTLITEAILRARDAAEAQKRMTVREGLRKYKWAVVWSSLMTLTQVMESYDYGLMGNLYGFPSFSERYGQLLPSGKYNIRQV